MDKLKLTIVLLATVLLNGCASTGDWSIYEPYTPVQYNTPLVNSIVDSTVSIGRTQAEGFIAIETMKAFTGLLY